MSSYRKIEKNSKWAKAADNLGFAKELQISEVSEEFVKDFNDPTMELVKTCVKFENGLDGMLLLNDTNEAKLQNKWSDTTEMDHWVGRKVFVTVQEYKNFNPGWVVTPMDASPQKEMDFDDDIPA